MRGVRGPGDSHPLKPQERRSSNGIPPPRGHRLPGADADAKWCVRVPFSPRAVEAIQIPQNNRHHNKNNNSTQRFPLVPGTLQLYLLSLTSCQVSDDPLLRMTPPGLRETKEF